MNVLCCPYKISEVKQLELKAKTNIDLNSQWYTAPSVKSFCVEFFINFSNEKIADIPLLGPYLYNFPEISKFL